MPRDPAPALIADATCRCLVSFKDCLKLTGTGHPRNISLVEDQLARFSLWVTNAGVFATPRASLEHRLQGVPGVQAVIIGLLETLQDRLHACYVCLSSLATIGAHNDPGADFGTMVRKVADETTLLFRLMNTIRKASKDAQNSHTAKTFVLQDDEGNNIEQTVRELFARNIQDQFPGISNAIKERLVATMLLRWKRILYTTIHYGKAPTRPTTSVTQPAIKLPPGLQSSMSAPMPTEASDVSKPSMATHISQSIVQSTTLTATTPTAAKLKEASSPSVASVSRTVFLENHHDLVFPPAPGAYARQKYQKLVETRQQEHVAQLEAIGMPSSFAGQHSYDSNAEVLERISEANREFERTLKRDWEDYEGEMQELVCPFCLYVLAPEDVLEEKQWRAHVINDLDAYVCLFEDCENPEELYRHSKDWLSHMRGHSLRWRCQSKSHGIQLFSSSAEYEDHLKTRHKGSFTDAQVHALASRTARTIGPLFPSCPLCGLEQTGSSLEDHIIGHLQSLALESLPAYHEDAMEGFSGDGKHIINTTTRPTSRTTSRSALFAAETSGVVGGTAPIQQGDENVTATIDTPEQESSSGSTSKELTTKFSLPIFQHYGSWLTASRPFFCTFCLEGNEVSSFKTKQDWKRHEQNYHEHGQRCRCAFPDCAEVFARNVEELMRHGHTHPNFDPRYHMDIVQTQKAYACGFENCRVLLNDWVQRCDHVAHHMRDLEDSSPSCWNYNRILRNLLKHPAVKDTWKPIRSRRCPMYRVLKSELSWDPGETRDIRRRLEYHDFGTSLEALLEELFYVGIPVEKRLGPTFPDHDLSFFSRFSPYLSSLSKPKGFKDSPYNTGS